MTKEVLTKDELFVSIDDTFTQLAQLLSSLDENGINKIPYQGSWTPGQLIRHVTKSTNGMAQAMLASPKLAERDVTQNVHQLKKTFLDFSKKINSPEFIIPEDEIYNKENSLKELNQSFEKLKENANKADLNNLVEGLPFGPTTKFELLHFVLFHTERHLHQMRRICEGLK
ncbi:MAG: DinB family protein [Bacteroidota bacterium]